jgi:isopropylmalate/homocitrate/citramalate synthase
VLQLGTFGAKGREADCLGWRLAGDVAGLDQAASQRPGRQMLDPADLGRSYKAIIRINSQSGKGGVAYVLENDFGFQLPKLMHKEIGKVVNR